MSTRYNTGNQIESADVRDMSDNAKNLDLFSNSSELSFADRLGVERQTIYGMNSEFNDQILNMGFSRVGTFSSGATLTNPRQTLLWDTANGGDGQEYGWSGTFPKTVPPSSTPSSTGGIAVGAWMSRFDPELKVQVREALRRSYAAAGYLLVDGSFEAGYTITTTAQSLLFEAEGVGYAWGGALPKSVPAGSSPLTVGGIGPTSWISKADVTVGSVLFEKTLILSVGVDTTGFSQGWYGGELVKLNFSGVINSIVREPWGVYHFNGSATEDALAYEKHRQRENGLIIGWGNTVEDEAALRRALTYAEPRGMALHATTGELLVTAQPQITVTAELELPHNVCLDMHGGALKFPASLARAIKARIGSGGVVENYLTMLKNAIIVAGDITRNNISDITAGVGIYTEVHGAVFQSVDFRGFGTGLKMGENSWVNRFVDCSFWYNRLAMEFDQTGFVNAGAGMVFDRCLFAWNAYVFRNKLCELTFNDCAFDQMYDRITDVCITSQSGTYNTDTIFNDCRFEADKAGAAPWFKTDSGVLRFVNPKFYGPMNAQYLFDGTGDVYIDGGINNLPATKVLAESFVNLRVKNHMPSSFSTCNRWQAPSVHWFNSSMGLGTSGYSAPAGAITVASGGAVIFGSRLQFKFAGAGRDAVFLGPVIKTNGARRAHIEFYSALGSGDLLYKVDYYCGSLKVGEADVIYAAVSPTPTLRNANFSIPNGVDGIQMRTQVGSAFTIPVEMSDFEIALF